LKLPAPCAFFAFSDFPLCEFSVLPVSLQPPAANTIVISSHYTTHLPCTPVEQKIAAGLVGTRTETVHFIDAVSFYRYNTIRISIYMLKNENFITMKRRWHYGTS
ncbi:MAG: hypothetical protein RSC00_09460, partial [Ruthenibacterium sp.]